jgi:hypothetical protein
MTESEIAVAIIAGALSGAIAAAVTLVYNSAQERRDRHREHFSRALQTVSSYEEFPYVVRRRNAGDPDGERLRISTEMRAVQADLSYHCAWLKTESVRVGEAYEALVLELRRVVGGLVHEAWLRPAVESDAEMNIGDVSPEVNKLKPYKDAYLAEVSGHLSLWPGWWVRSTRG